jgi:outer membrane protein OmpA-like peptidoglycan-associated protein
MVTRIFASGMLTLGLVSGLVAQELPKLEFSTPQALEGKVNSSAEETYPLVAPDKSMFFVRSFDSRNVGGKFTGHDIWQAKGSEAPASFSAPSNSIGSLNNQGNNAVVGISTDGNRLYLMNSYEVENSKKIGISFSDRTENGWEAPKSLDIPALSFKGTFYGVNVSGDGNSLFLAMDGEGSAGKEDLYVIYKEGSMWKGPARLGGVNTVDREIAPFYDSDRQLLFFASNRPGGAGDLDIYMSARQGDSWTNWSAAQALPASVNTENFDGYFSVNKNGDAYFARNKKGGLSDVFYTKMSVVVEEPTPEPEPEPVVVKEPEPEPVVVKEPEPVVVEEPPVVVEKPAVVIPAEVYVVHFAFEGVSPNEQEVLNTVAKALNENKAINVKLVGHTDNVGTLAINMSYSKRRAEVVKSKLMGMGVSSSRISTDWKAFNVPTQTNDTPEGRAANRRTEISFVLSEKAK